MPRCRRHHVSEPPTRKWHLLSGFNHILPIDSRQRWFASVTAGYFINPTHLKITSATLFKSDEIKNKYLLTHFSTRVNEKCPLVLEEEASFRLELSSWSQVSLVLPQSPLACTRLSKKNCAPQLTHSTLRCGVLTRQRYSLRQLSLMSSLLALRPYVFMHPT